MSTFFVGSTNKRLGTVPSHSNTLDEGSDYRQVYVQHIHHPRGIRIFPTTLTAILVSDQPDAQFLL